MAKMTAVQVLLDAADLKDRKSKDYQGDLWTEEDYFPFGHDSYVHMLWTKMLRIRALSTNVNPNFESLEDSLTDLAVYAAMYAAYVVNQTEDIK